MVQIKLDAMLIPAWNACAPADPHISAASMLVTLVVCSLGTCLTKKNDLAGAQSCFEQVSENPTCQTIRVPAILDRPC
jgi:hypothetical protein